MVSISGLNSSLMAMRFGRDFSKQKSAPRILIGDDFSTKVVDIDGDGIPDLSHGNLIHRLIQSRLPQAQVDCYQLKGSFQAIELSGILEFLDFIQAQMKNGQPYQAVNFSIGLPQKITPQNITDVAPTQTSGSDVVQQITEQLELLATNRNAPQFFVAGGNSGKTQFNPFTSAKNCLGVKAVDAKGNLASFTSDNPFCTKVAQGVFTVLKTDNGFDIDEDGQTDVLNHEVSGGYSTAERFNHLPLKAVLASEGDVEQLRQSHYDQVSDKVFSWPQLIEAGVVSAERSQLFKSFGDYVALRNGSPAAYFRLGHQRQLVFDPDNSGQTNGVSVIYGTSLATPLALAESLISAVV